MLCEVYAVYDVRTYSHLQEMIGQCVTTITVTSYNFLLKLNLYYLLLKLQ